MTQQHPITPPRDKIHNWLQLEKIGCDLDQILIGAAQWGADQELEACVAWLDGFDREGWAAEQLRAARRPKPPSLKEQALEALAHILSNSSTQLGADTIRRALEKLPDHTSEGD